MDKQNVLHPYNEIMLVHKKERSSDTFYNVDETLRKSQIHTADHMLYDSTYIKHIEEANSQRQKVD